MYKINMPLFLQVDLRGKVKNIPERILSSEPYMPLYEAIMNSIQSIIELGRDDGQINIKISRDNTLSDDGTKKTPIRSFEIIDNGIGFNEENFKSFKISDTTYKIDIGGKGIGRFLWLKAFEKVKIESIYFENDVYWKRIIDFDLKNGIQEKTTKSSETKLATIVKLINFKEKYRLKEKAYKTPEKISQRILEHFLSVFVMDKHPCILVNDDSVNDGFNLNTLFLELKKEMYEESFQIKDREFKIFHLNLRNTHNQMNKIVYCAYSRTVFEDKIDFSGESYLTDSSNENFYYACYVSSEYLDNHVDDSRISFSIPKTDSELAAYIKDTNLSLDTIKKEVEMRIKKKLSTYFEKIKKKKFRN